MTTRTPHDRSPPRVVSWLACAAILVICAATSKAPPVPPPSVPMWKITTKPLQLPCGNADVWVAKSGKAGLGVTVQTNPTPGQPCVTAVSASLKFPDRVFPGRVVESRNTSELSSADRELSRQMADPNVRDATYHYIAFELDNVERWNRGDRIATFELSIVVAGQTQSWTLSATHEYVDFPLDPR